MKERRKEFFEVSAVSRAEARGKNLFMFLIVLLIGFGVMVCILNNITTTNTIQLSSGEIVTCQVIQYNNWGGTARFSQCTNGKTYENQNNYVILNTSKVGDKDETT